MNDGQWSRCCIQVILLIPFGGADVFSCRFFNDSQDSMVISIVNFVNFTVKLLKQEINKNTGVSVIDSGQLCGRAAYKAKMLKRCYTLYQVTTKCNNFV